MRKEDLKNWTADRLKDEIVRLDKENTDLQNSHMKLYNDTKDKIRCLVRENQSLKQRIKDLEDIGNNYEPQFAPDDDISAFNYECVKQWTTEMGCKRKIQELQDQHQQDCIRINDLTTTVHVLAGLYSALRKNVGMD